MHRDAVILVRLRPSSKARQASELSLTALGLLPQYVNVLHHELFGVRAKPIAKSAIEAMTRPAPAAASPRGPLP